MMEESRKVCRYLVVCAFVCGICACFHAQVCIRDPSITITIYFLN